ncbi:MAG: hypothetical protein AAGH67_18825 [Cyanobacteria bacterium P01_H01_bin.162]
MLPTLSPLSPVGSQGGLLPTVRSRSSPPLGLPPDRNNADLFVGDQGTMVMS